MALNMFTLENTYQTVGKHWELNWLTDSNNINGTLPTIKNVDKDEYSWIEQKSLKKN